MATPKKKAKKKIAKKTKTSENKKEYNNTHLDPEKTFERHVYHRDQFAHYLRWTHVLKTMKIGQSVLDFGAGPGSLCEVLYRNRFKAAPYLGLEYSTRLVNKANKKFEGVDWASFQQRDIAKKNATKDLDTFDIVVSFEVIEHVNKKNAKTYLKNLAHCCHEDTTILLSTPVYDEKVGAAQNHIINGIVQEFTYEELQKLLEKCGFEVQDTFGTFASQKDYKPKMNKWQTEMFKELKKYYDSNLVSNLMAPFFPEESRNTLWRLKYVG